MGSSGLISCKTVKRGRVNIQAENSGAELNSTMFSEADPIQDFSSLMDMHEDEITSNLPSLHEIKQAASVAVWAAIREGLMDVCTGNNAMPVDQRCTCCSLSDAVYRCLQCGPYTYYCKDCLNVQHTENCVYHIPELWTVSGYKAM